MIVAAQVVIYNIDQGHAFGGLGWMIMLTD
jgi:hypothetical protein